MGVWRINTVKCSINRNNEVTDDIGVNKSELINSGDENIVVVEKVSENNSEIKNGVLESCLLYTSRCV